jgi:hypothetical protein
MIWPFETEKAPLPDGVAVGLGVAVGEGDADGDGVAVGRGVAVGIADVLRLAVSEDTTPA